MKFSATLSRVLAVVSLLAFAGSAAAQQAYPIKPIRIIVAFVPGGGFDLLARMVGQKLIESWGQPVIVDNRPGGNGVVGTDAVAKSLPNGYTILSMGTGLVTTPILVPTPYDAFKDFAPVATVGKTEYLLVINPSVSANNLQEFIALARSKPGQLNYASTGSGSIQHLGNELFIIMAGVKIQHIPYKGSGPAVTDLVGGQVQMSIQSPPSVLAYITSGRLKAVAITGEARSSALPQVPTFAEAGLPSFDIRSWFGFVAPAGTPKAVIDKLATEIAKMLAMPDIKQKLASQGMDPFISTPDQMAALMKADLAKFTKIIKSANIKLEN